VHDQEAAADLAPLKCFEIRFDSSNHESFNHQDTKAQILF